MSDVLDIISSCVKSRKDAIFSAYEINNEEIKEKIDELFKKIEALAEGCSDVTDFESKFATSELNQEYINLFTEIATSCTPITHETVSNPDIKSDGQYIADELKSELEYQIKDKTLPARRIAREEAYDAARNTPIIGDVLNVKQHIDLFAKFGKLVKKKDKDKKEKEEE